ncbi:MAG: metallophosphoesterase family protein [bacterium]|nr:metallophosphoesterase family protein [bacterium]
MRLAVFSDIHGNLEALQAVLEQIDQLGVDRLLCLGDVVGYGADPNACSEQVFEVAEVVLIGNHDRAALGLEDTEFFNPIALSAIRWTADVLANGPLGCLRACPLTVEEGDTLYAHASPFEPAAWHYLHEPHEGRHALSLTEARLCFVGHSHHAFICSEFGVALIGQGEVALSPDDRYLVNVGSVGQPRDGDPRAAFLIWDQEALTVRLYRTEYDIATAQTKIRAAHLPGALADRLGIGR